jgi:drug/metabolite transporter (DMT)-like permease
VPSKPTSPALIALGSAALFGLATPLAKLLLGDQTPQLLAGLLYLGSGLALGAAAYLRRDTITSRLSRSDIPTLAGVILLGGIIAPVALLRGLDQAPAATVSLLLNLEGVLTAALAWTFFHEHASRRTVTGLALIVVGGIVLSWQPGAGLVPGALWIVLACACWAADNNLTQRLSGRDPVHIAGIKGIVAGTVNLTIALALGAKLPGPGPALFAGAVGALGYGLSLVLFVVALSKLGTARTGAYFATAPFVGAVASFVLIRETLPQAFIVASILMGAGVWLHLTEKHGHAHRHEPVTHTHPHRHDDDHHDHIHDPAVVETHTHEHVHAASSHVHPHTPDLHHRHDHESP